MPKIITDSQEHEIEELALEHRDALIAYGADLYLSGLIKGAIIGALGVSFISAISVLVKEFKKKK